MTVMLPAERPGQYLCRPRVLEVLDLTRSGGSSENPMNQEEACTE
jgi:hypothetical protein